MKVLLWKIGALGDVVMTTPLVRQLRRNLPDAQIDYLVGRSFRAVLDGNPHLDRVLDFDESVLFDGRLSALGHIRARLRGYDAVYVLDKHWIFTWLALCAGIPRRIGFARRAVEGLPHTTRVHVGPLRHEVHYYLDLLEAEGLAVDRDDLALELPPMQPFDLAGPYVVAVNAGGNNPGEASAVRQMPEHLFGALVRQLASKARVVFLGSQQERPYYESFARAHSAFNLCGRTTLQQTWDVLARADSVYTTDTGLMHMAAAVNSNVVAIFGPTHPLRKCPVGARWVWRAEHLYDHRYELYGRVPDGRFFDGMRPEDILNAGERDISGAGASSWIPLHQRPT
ncbi:glycosyltransferase family 9 protein [Ramlibacter ginsenosidimutans]|uniref:Glycosyltransferase family 9 protein n=1 Tax=Ramlibacter ginsenosidimutans TaxID=502333 RepID=A0A934TR22_9BURK|nr:glycosyltransferase family 9 protein [Ramlibacter ginsenosidimutans]MBK6005769.1 glycosyltransferase family 9 protein [Ramlibacter ginsenosidimutans]